jgi:hypothetical protein
MAKAEEKPEDYKGPRTPIVTKHPCGFCNANDHHMCRHELAYYEKLWICPCTCNKNWVPKDLGTAVKEKPKRKEKINDQGRTSGEHSDGSDDAGRGESLASSEIPDAVGDSSNA